MFTREEEVLKLEDMAASLHTGVPNDECIAYLKKQGRTALTSAELFIEAEILYRKALDLVRQIGDRAVEAEILYNLGRLYQDPPRMSVFFKNQLSDDQFVEAFMGRAGVVHHNDPQNQRHALSYFNQALQLARKEKRTVTENLLSCQYRCCLSPSRRYQAAAAIPRAGGEGGGECDRS